MCAFYIKLDNLEAAKLVLKQMFSPGSSHILADMEI